MQTPAAQAQSAVRIEQTFSGSLTAMPSENLGVSGAFYIPVYSSVAMSQGKLRADFSVTLSIHTPCRIFRHRRENGGKLSESAGGAEAVLHRRSVFVPATDVRGGTGANFVVDWAAAGEIAEPVVEALMFGGIGSGHYAFVSQGRPIKVGGKN